MDDQVRTPHLARSGWQEAWKRIVEARKLGIHMEMTLARPEVAVSFRSPLDMPSTM